MPRKSNKLARNYLDGYLNELAHTWYEQDEAKAFRHAAFQTLVPDPTLSDAQVIEMTAIDQSGDLEVDGWFVDEDAETVFLFQAAGGTSKVNEGKVVKFWEAPHELLNAERVRNSTNQLVKELSTELDSKLNQEYSITMVFAAKGGFVPSARAFASSRKNEDRSFTSLIDKDLSSRCSFQLFDYNDVANTFYSFRVALTEPQTNVVLAINRDWTYVVDKTGPQSIRATVAASELVRVFKENGYKLFTLNPRGPIATAKVNGNIRKTLDTTVGRTNFHLLNNGMCATCEGFDLDKKNGALSITNFQMLTVVKLPLL